MSNRCLSEAEMGLAGVVRAYWFSRKSGGFPLSDGTWTQTHRKYIDDYFNGSASAYGEFCRTKRSRGLQYYLDDRYEANLELSTITHRVRVTNGAAP